MRLSREAAACRYARVSVKDKRKETAYHVPIETGQLTKHNSDDSHHHVNPLVELVPLISRSSISSCLHAARLMNVRRAALNSL